MRLVSGMIFFPNLFGIDHSYKHNNIVVLVLDEFHKNPNFTMNKIDSAQNVGEEHALRLLKTLLRLSGIVNPAAH